MRNEKVRIIEKQVKDEVNFTERDGPFRMKECPRCGDPTENDGLCDECQ